MYHYAGNNPIRYIDPTGLYEYEVQTGDTLSQMVQDHNKKYNTNYSYKDIALHNGIKDPDKINVGQKIDIPIPGEEMRYPVHHPLKKHIYPEKTHSRVFNICIGLGEVVGGFGVWVATIAGAAAVTVGTEGVGVYVAGVAVGEGLATGAFLIGDGFGRIVGAHDAPVSEDIVNAAIPIKKDIADSINDASKKNK